MTKPHKQRLLLGLLLGVLSVSLFRIIDQGITYISFRDLNTYLVMLEQERDAVRELKDQIGEVHQRIDELERVEDPDELIDVLGERIEQTRMQAGLVPLSGEGVIIIVNDADRELGEHEDPNNLIVHDLDVRAIVDDLKAAGAEAISINGERYVFSKSQIVCNGPTININGQQFAQPFIIKAIGDRKYLESAVNAPGRYGYILRQWGIFVEVNTAVSLTIPAYRGQLDYDYLLPKERDAS